MRGLALVLGAALELRKLVGSEHETELERTAVVEMEVRAALENVMLEEDFSPGEVAAVLTLLGTALKQADPDAFENAPKLSGS